LNVPFISPTSAGPSSRLGAVFQLPVDGEPFDPDVPVVGVGFQFYPEQIVREFARDGSNGAVIEQWVLTIELDATDSLEHGSPVATTVGVGPDLAAFELMFRGQFESGRRLAIRLGRDRIVPVTVECLRVTESAVGAAAHPLRASVCLTLRVVESTDGNLSPVAKDLLLARATLRQHLAAMPE
jgi:hypothetical protein